MGQSGLLAFYMGQANSKGEDDTTCEATSPGDVCNVWDEPPPVADFGYEQAAREDERIDPADGQSWTWDAYRRQYGSQYSPDELSEYWQTMRPASANFDAKIREHSQSTGAPSRMIEACR